MPRTAAIAALAMLSLAAACNADRTSAPQRVDMSLASAKGGGAPGNDSRAQWYVYPMLSDGVTATNAFGDGRALDGTPVANPATDPSAYDGEAQCGVRGTINWYSTQRPSGDAFFGPTGGTTSLCQGTPRSMSVDLDGSIATGQFTITATEVMQLAIGESRVQDGGWVFNQPNCDRLLYRAASGSGLKVTRLSGDTSRQPGEWMVESTGTHIAGCYNLAGGGRLKYVGDHYVPFSARIVEVLR